MKITAVSAVLCLAASAMAASIPADASSEGSLNSNNIANTMDKRAAPIDKKAHSEHGIEAHKDTPKKDDASTPETPAAPAVGAKGENKAAGAKDEKQAAEAKDDKGKKPESGGADAADPQAVVPKEIESPIWLVQPVAESVWSQGTTYVIVWGPNPDPNFAKNIAPKSAVEVRLMQGPPTELKAVDTLAKSADSSLNSFKWIIPDTLAPGKDYTIRITQPGKVDTYSHYFEVVPAGDKRASKSNVGEKLELPVKGDVPQPLNKGPPAAPPNPFPAEKPAPNPAPANPVPKPAAAKPAVNGATSQQNANILAFAMTLFAAVYFL
ncbi:hypothetical protein BGZ96_007476 [Linnemannia gamsii]|uniref:Yeast cell wall synthesis Kre9/Knh1-like N-terminal domain-containing protein n=1 Tax=Linnemannia gamsii TaxID=64522 RepID=A0ABQ7K0K4_9FUNG|nr:hypothetical protein BGZ96_007476 [Linnemannia gamsii]